MISRAAWNKYLVRLRQLSDKASDELIRFITNGHDLFADDSYTKEVIDYAYALATKYGEGAGSLASEMYDALAELSGKVVPPAIPAQTAQYGEVAKAVYGTKLLSKNPEVMSSAISRLVKMVEVDTMQQNALRDGAEWAWIPSGDTCAFCLMLASNGWQPASKKAVKNGHAEHVHANCDCTYAIRFSSDVEVEGYNDGEQYREMYYDYKGIDQSVLKKYEEEHGGLPSTPEERLDLMRRQFYKENSDKINAQKRSAYEKRKELNSSAAEEYEVTE